MTNRLGDPISITEKHIIQCPQCGGTHFEFSESSDSLESPKEPALEEWATCVTCAQSFPLDDLRQAGISQALKVATAEIQDQVQRMVKGLFK